MPAHALLWTDSTTAYLEAIKAAGLAERVVVDTLPRKEKPTAEQLARAEVLMAYAVPPGVLPAMHAVPSSDGPSSWARQKSQSWRLAQKSTWNE